jgi:hypothetical protein
VIPKPKIHSLLQDELWETPTALVSAHSWHTYPQALTPLGNFRSKSDVTYLISTQTKSMVCPSGA